MDNVCGRLALVWGDEPGGCPVSRPMQLQWLTSAQGSNASETPNTVDVLPHGVQDMLPSFGGGPRRASCSYRAQQPAAGDGKQLPLVPRSRCLPRLSRSVGRPRRGEKNQEDPLKTRRLSSTWEGVSPRVGTPPDAERCAATACR